MWSECVSNKLLAQNRALRLQAIATVSLVDWHAVGSLKQWTVWRGLSFGLFWLWGDLSYPLTSLCLPPISVCDLTSHSVHCCRYVSHICCPAPGSGLTRSRWNGAERRNPGLALWALGSAVSLVPVPGHSGLSLHLTSPPEMRPRSRQVQSASSFPIDPVEVNACLFLPGVL